MRTRGPQRLWVRVLRTGAAVMAALALTGCGGRPSTTPRRSSASGTAVPLCRAADLSAAAGAKRAATGHVLDTVLFTNRSTTCRLQGYPSITGITPSGSEVPLVPAHGTYFGDLVPADLRHGHTGYLWIATGGSCGTTPDDDFSGLIVAMPGGGSVTVGGVAFSTACGIAESQLGEPAESGG